MSGFDRITFDPNILGGKACIRGMRIPVSLVINLVANGMSVQGILDEYPDLEPEDIEQALRYAAWDVEEGRQESKNWSILSLATALRGMEDEESPTWTAAEE